MQFELVEEGLGVESDRVRAGADEGDDVALARHAERDERVAAENVVDKRVVQRIGRRRRLASSMTAKRRIGPRTSAGAMRRMTLMSVVRLTCSGYSAAAGREASGEADGEVGACIVVSSGVVLAERLVGDNVADAARAAAREDDDDDDADVEM
jgi:hypothetical protein